MARGRGASWLKRIGWAVAIVSALVLVVALVRTIQSDDRPEPPAALSLRIDRERAAATLSELIRMPTVTPPPVPRDPRPGYLDLLIERYAEPLGLEHQVIDHRTLLLRWRAGETDAPPILFLSHADVVPVPEAEREGWTHPPFDGVVSDGYVWGRGALDDKGAIVAQLEAIAALSAANLRPRHDVVLLINPDEEIGGADGAGRVVARHWERLGEPWAVLDEGSFVADDMVPETRLVPVGTAEKRYVTITLSVNGESGHSSMPRESDAPRVLAVALAKVAELELPARILPATDAFLERISARMPFTQRLALRNRWLLGFLVTDLLASRPASNGMIRDTMALTILEAGVKDNVIPAHAQATMNLRLLPGSDLDALLARIRSAIDDPRVQLEVITDEGPSPEAPIEGEVWTSLESALRAAYPDERSVVAPMISPATTDARFFASRGVPSYRLVPFVLDANERGRVHGIDERVSIQNLADAARVYAHVMRYW